MFKTGIAHIKPIPCEGFMCIIQNSFLNRKPVTSPCFRLHQFLCTYLHLQDWVVFDRSEVSNIYLVILVTFHSSHKPEKVQQAQCVF